MKIEAFRKDKRVTKPHKHAKYLELVYLNGGTGLHVIDGQEYRIEPPVCFLVRKEEVHHWAIDSEPNGFVLIFKDAFMADCEDGQMEALILNLTKYQHFRVAEDENLDLLFQLTAAEYQKESSQSLTFLSLLKALLAKLLAKAPEGRPIELANKAGRFQAMLMDEPRNDVQFYAKALHTSAQNLNALCQKSFGQSASEIVGKYIVREAKRLLIYTNLSVTEIAYRLHFSDCSNFIKYFKRLTGDTPLHYRRFTA